MYLYVYIFICVGTYMSLITYNISSFVWVKATFESLYAYVFVYILFALFSRHKQCLSVKWTDLYTLSLPQYNGQLADSPLHLPRGQWFCTRNINTFRLTFSNESSECNFWYFRPFVNEFYSHEFNSQQGIIGSGNDKLLYEPTMVQVYDAYMCITRPEWKQISIDDYIYIYTYIYTAEPCIS